MSQWLEGLNPEQVEAVLHNYGPQLILAGAGTGKTTVLVTRTGRLIDEKIVRPDQVLVLTFTNKAAKELKERVTDKIGKKSKKIWAGTFHSFGVSVLKNHYNLVELPKNFGIIDAGDSKAILKAFLKDINHYDKDSVNLDKILSLMSDWRSRGQTKVRDSDTSDADLELVQILLPKYLLKLKLLGVVDFDGLLLLPIQIFRDNELVLKSYQEQFLQVMVDEFQDTNSIQMKLINQLVAGHNNITVVGDDDQSIYGWRGAVISHILNFPKHFAPCNVVRLQRNYRSTSSILSVANSVIQKNTNRHDKVLRAEGHDGTGEIPELFTYANEEEESAEIVSQINHFVRKGFSFKDIAVLYRSNSQGGLIEGDLRRGNIDYKITGGTAFFDRSEVKDILAYIQCAFLSNEIALRRVINNPTRGIGAKTIGFFVERSKDKGMNFQDCVYTYKVEQSEKPYKGVIEFLDIVKKLRVMLLLKNDKTPGQNLLTFLDDIGYKALVYSNYKDPQIGHKKWMVVEILSRVLDGFINKVGHSQKTLQEFIHSMVLRDQMEEANDQKNQNKVQLMTLHACKGLEYPVILLVGCEEDIIPHKTLGLDIDEERRLFYVGLTRAKKHLVLTKAETRKRYGQLKPVAPSRFLLEIPEGMVKEFPDGNRPIKVEERKSMLADLYKKLEENSKPV